MNEHPPIGLIREAAGSFEGRLVLADWLEENPSKPTDYLIIRPLRDPKQKEDLTPLLDLLENHPDGKSRFKNIQKVIKTGASGLRVLTRRGGWRYYLKVCVKEVNKKLRNPNAYCSLRILNDEIREKVDAHLLEVRDTVLNLLAPPAEE